MKKRNKMFSRENMFGLSIERYNKPDTCWITASIHGKSVLSHVRRPTTTITFDEYIKNQHDWGFLRLYEIMVASGIVKEEAFSLSLYMVMYAWHFLLDNNLQNEDKKLFNFLSRIKKDDIRIVCSSSQSQDKHTIKSRFTTRDFDIPNITVNKNFNEKCLVEATDMMKYGSSAIVHHKSHSQNAFLCSMYETMSYIFNKGTLSTMDNAAPPEMHDGLFDRISNQIVFAAWAVAWGNYPLSDKES
jgi:hypothetical protein